MYEKNIFFYNFASSNSNIQNQQAFIIMIASRQQLEETALSYGMLPFFSNRIKGFSVEEMAAPGMLFGDNSDDWGCWGWKGPVIRRQTTAYGKFFRRKAGFVSLELYPDFINYRRAQYPVEAESPEARILEIVKSCEASTSAEMRNIIFGAAERKRAPRNLADAVEVCKPRRSILEPALQHLQMGGRLLIADFEYKYTARGDRYGWGVALYTTPEIWFGEGIAEVPRTPEESFIKLCDHLASKLPDADRNEIVKLLK